VFQLNRLPFPRDRCFDVGNPLHQFARINLWNDCPDDLLEPNPDN